MSGLNKLWILLLLVLVISNSAAAQNKSSYQLEGSFGNYKIGFPLQEVLSFPGHSSLGLSLSKHSSLALAHAFPSLDWVYHSSSSSGQGYWLGINWGFHLPVWKKLYAQAKLGVGLHHHFSAKQVFSFSNGEYSPIKDLGQVKPGIHPQLVVGYAWQKASLFITYRVGTELFYSKESFFLPVNFLQFGMSFQL